MQTGDQRRPEGQDKPGVAEAGTRPQQAGEAETTRFGMEDGDNTNIPATGGPRADEESLDRSSELVTGNGA